MIASITEAQELQDIDTKSLKYRISLCISSVSSLEEEDNEDNEVTLRIEEYYHKYRRNPRYHVVGQ